MVDWFTAIRGTDRKNEVFKQRPLLVAHQVSGQAGLHSRYQLESRPKRLVNPFCQHDLDSFNWEEWTKKQFQIAKDGVYGFECKLLDRQDIHFLGTTSSDYLKMAERIGTSHYIILKRQNTLRLAISQRICFKRGNRHIKEKPDQVVTKIRIDIENEFTPPSGEKGEGGVLGYLREIQRTYEKYETLLSGKKTLTISYEDDILKIGPSIGYRKICEFLGSGPIDFRVGAWFTVRKPSGEYV